ncbi:MAG: thioredoxin domain-containing protein [Rhodothermales bacterium]|nr:thioredoxin domain-containing protein [Rhodothermales bacterium]
MKFLFVLLLSALFVLPARAQSADNSETRKARLHANLHFLFPQLSEYQVTIGPIEPSAVVGMEEGAFVINGQQVQRFLTDPQDATLYLLAGGPFNAGLSQTELDDMGKARELEAAAEAQKTHEALLEATAGMPSKGPADAPVTIVEFSDFQCPYCAAAADTLRQVLTKYPDQVRLVYVQFPLDSIHPWARAASIASICAADQSIDAFWSLHDSYFSNQRAITKENILAQSRGRLGESGIDLAAWDSCADDAQSEGYQRASVVIERSMNVGGQFGIESTPGFFVNGYPINGARESAQFIDLIERALADTGE